MVLYFTGTGNSRYLARRIAEGLEMPLYDLNACIKAGDTAPVQTGRDVVLVTPTYAWRIPRVVSGWLGKTALTGAERIWFVMNCGSEIGNAAKYNQELAAQMDLFAPGNPRCSSGCRRHPSTNRAVRLRSASGLMRRRIRATSAITSRQTITAILIRSLISTKKTRSLQDCSAREKASVCRILRIW